MSEILDRLRKLRNDLVKVELVKENEKSKTHEFTSVINDSKCDIKLSDEFTGDIINDSIKCDNNLLSEITGDVINDEITNGDNDLLDAFTNEIINDAVIDEYNSLNDFTNEIINESLVIGDGTDYNYEGIEVFLKDFDEKAKHRQGEIKKYRELLTNAFITEEHLNCAFKAKNRELNSSAGNIGLMITDCTVETFECVIKKAYACKRMVGEIDVIKNKILQVEEEIKFYIKLIKNLENNTL